MILHSTSLDLISPAEELLPEICDYFRRNRHFLEPWQPERDESFYTEDVQSDNLKSDILSQEFSEMKKFWIRRKNHKQIIGQIGYSQIIRGIFLSCYLGYSLDHEFINQGYMSEALSVTIEYIFSVLRLHRIEANVMPRNIASLRVLEKLGFQNEGLARKYLKINGTWEDHIHMVLLNENEGL